MPVLLGGCQPANRALPGRLPAPPQALPFVAETVSQRRHVEQLEARLAELEEAFRVFSRPKVLVEA